jgi:hypothetical protein
MATVDDVTYELLPGKEGWRAVIKTGGKSTTLIDGVGRTRAYTVACRHHHYSEVPQPKAAAK